jgi:branched-chain amino acid aminotransferase
MPTVVSLDGRLVPPDQAVVSVLDRGFLLGESVYEVLRTYGGTPFEEGPHLARLAGSARLAALPLPWDEARLGAEVRRAVSASLGGDPPDPAAAPWNVGERSARLVVTRGGGEAAPGVPPRVIVIAEPLRAPPRAAYRDGVAAILSPVDRGGDEPAAKTGARLAHARAQRAAREAGAHEALFLGSDGTVTEGASSNLFAVRGGRLLTPPLEAGLLAGVTRAVVLRLARAAGLPVTEERLDPAALRTADELFITSTAREVLPVVRLEGAPVGDGRPGPVTRRLHAAFRRLAGGPTL